MGCSVPTLRSFHRAASCHTGHPKAWGHRHGVGFLVSREMRAAPPPVSFSGRGDSQNCRSRLARN